MSVFLTVSTIGGECILTADEDATIETVDSLKLAIQQHQRGVHCFFQLRLILGDRILDDNTPLATLGRPPLRITLVTLPIIEDDDSGRALKEAINNGVLEEVRRLLQLPVNPNIHVGVLRNTVMFNAACRGDPAIAELLIKANADPNAPCDYFDDGLDNVVESTPLHVAFAASTR